MLEKHLETDSGVMARLDRLERSNRRLRIVLAATALAAAGFGLAGLANSQPSQSATQREIQTQRLVIVGSDQQPRVMLQGNTDGATVCLYGPDQPATETRSRGGGQGGSGTTGGVSGGMTSLAPRMRLMVEGEECRIELIAPGGTVRAKLRQTAEGPALDLFDEAGNPIEG